MNIYSLIFIGIEYFAKDTENTKSNFAQSRTGTISSKGV